MLVSCPECGRENVSNKATACPGCGFNVAQYFETHKLEEQPNKAEKLNPTAEKDFEEEPVQSSKPDTLKDYSQIIENLQRQGDESSSAQQNGRAEDDEVPMPAKPHIHVGLSVAVLIFSALSAVFLVKNEGSGLSIFVGIVLLVLALILIIGLINDYRRELNYYKLANSNWQQYKLKKAADDLTTKKLQEEQEAAKREKAMKAATIYSIYRANKLKGIPCCPKCGSTSITTVNRGYSVITGFIGSGKPMNVCQMCGYKFEPGK